ncbi:protein yellow-like isoform X1 [Diabrotica virgifera virgifera]|uniref:Protein yellow-like isoform X2 n=1 Tax=Diabrotica virgifera virgifera TaxID=50390 RepID=A0A6P7GKM3_DIAVI|nr:protein yellow-like isoform X1 [Diabrotica virgifera virgifera]
MISFTRIVIITFVGNVVVCSTQKRDFSTIFKWTQLEFDYPSSYERDKDILTGNFLPGKPAPIDVDVYYNTREWEGNKIFVTVPRFQLGVPATLGTLSAKTFNGNPVLKPYPNWNWHRNPERCNRDRIISVYRVQVDECGRLWVLDTGILLQTIICPPQILVFDLQTDTLIHRYEIPSNQYESRSILVTPVIEILDSYNYCQNTFAYFADCQTYSIVVYDLKNYRSWRVTDKTMYPYPDYGTYNVQGDSFELMDGILGMSLSPYSDGGQRKLFYHGMSSPTENWIYTAHLRNESLSRIPQPQLFHTFSGKRRTQAVAEAIDSNGIMYFGLVGEVKVACFNTRVGDYGGQGSGTVADNPVTLQFPTGVKVVKSEHGDDELWILTSRFQKVITDTLNPNEINFRILAVKTKHLIPGTSCGLGYIVDPSHGSKGSQRTFDIQKAEEYNEFIT